MSGSRTHLSPDDPDDAMLLAAHVNGDALAFTTLVQRHRDRLWAVAVRTMNGDREEAADAVQDALISAMRNAGSFRGDSAVTTWLHRIVVNACLDRLRRKASRPSVPWGERDLPSPGDDHAAVDARITVRLALAQLPPEQREAIVLVDLEDYSVADAAQILGVPTGTVKSRCSRGRTALAAALRPDGDAGSDHGGGGNHEAGPYVASTQGPEQSRPADHVALATDPPAEPGPSSTNSSSTWSGR